MKTQQEPGDAPALRAIAACFNREAPLGRSGDSASQMLVRDRLVAAAALTGEQVPGCFILKTNR